MLYRQSELFHKPNSPRRRKSDRSFLVLVLQTMGAVYVTFYLCLGLTYLVTNAASEQIGEQLSLLPGTGASTESQNTKHHNQRSHANGRTK